MSEVAGWPLASVLLSHDEYSAAVAGKGDANSSFSFTVEVDGRIYTHVGVKPIFGPDGVTFHLTEDTAFAMRPAKPSGME